MNNNEILDFEQKTEELVANLEEINKVLKQKTSDREEFEKVSEKFSAVIESIQVELKSFSDAVSDAEIPKMLELVKDVPNTLENYKKTCDEMKSSVQSCSDLVKNLNKQINKMNDDFNSKLDSMTSDISFIKDWIKTNGDILVENSRSGIFSKKK